MFSGFLQTVSWIGSPYPSFSDGLLGCLQRPERRSRLAWVEVCVVSCLLLLFHSNIGVAGLFIIDGIITVPIALLGFLIMPGALSLVRMSPRRSL